MNKIIFEKKRYHINWLMVHTYVLTIGLLLTILITIKNNNIFIEKIRSMNLEIQALKNEVAVDDTDLRLHDTIYTLKD